MSRRRLVLLGVAAAVLLAAAVVVGRSEGSRFDDEQNEGIGAVMAAVGPLEQPSLAHFRYHEGVTCLVYERNGDDLALELCFEESSGRVVEAIDRRGDGERRWTLRPHPEAAEYRADMEEVRRLTREVYQRARAEALRRAAEQES